MSTVSHTISQLSFVVEKRLRDAGAELREEANKWLLNLARGAEDLQRGTITPGRYKLMIEQAEASMVLAGANELVVTEQKMLSGLLDAALKIAAAAI